MAWLIFCIGIKPKNIWAFKVKHKADISIDQIKTCLVVKVNSQREDINYKNMLDFAMTSALLAQMI